MEYTKLDNPHAHLPKPENWEELKILLYQIAGNTDFLSATHFANRVEKCLSPSDLETIANSSLPRKYIKFKPIGNNTYLLKIRDLSTIIYVSQEIRTKQGFHITGECCDKTIEEGLDARKTVELIHRYNGKALLEHPFTLDAVLIQYRLLNFDLDYEKIKLLHELLYMIDGVEVFNSMNTLWMAISNTHAKNFVRNWIKRNGIYVPQLAGGDEHYNPVGKTGNLLPEESLDFLLKATGSEIQEWRWQQYKNGNFKRKEKLTSPLEFAKYMIIPTIKRLIFKEEKDFKTSTKTKVI